jgi:hypothetical protein
MHAGAARVRPAGRSALVLYHVRPITGRSASASERRGSLGHGLPELLDVETARRTGALVCDGRSLRRIVWLSSHGGSLLHPLLWCQTLALLVAGRAAAGSPCNTLVPAVCSRVVAIGYSAKVRLPVVFDRADTTRSHASGRAQPICRPRPVSIINSGRPDSSACTRPACRLVDVCRAEVDIRH